MLVDDHRSVLWGLQKLIDSAAPRMKVVGTAMSGAAALRAIQSETPEIVLLDLALDGEDGLTFIPEIRRMGGPKVLIVTGLRDPDLGQTAIMAGASGIVNKSQPAEVILHAIECVQRGELWFDRGTTAKVVNAFRNREDVLATEHSSAGDILTPTERKIVAAVVEHKSAPNKVIAASLGISQHTLRNHLAAIYAKLGVHRRLDLVLYAIANGPSENADRGFGTNGRAGRLPRASSECFSY